jgi:hypothetical protein
LRGAVDVRGIGDVTDDTANAGCELIQAFDRCLQRVRLDIGEHHVHARFRKRFLQGKADTGGAAGDEGRFAGKSRMAVLPGSGASLLA